MMHKVQKVKGDMCEFGMTQEDRQGTGHVKKSTGFMIHAPAIATALAQTCQGGHRHITLVNGRAKQAEIYPDKLCTEILKGLVQQMKTGERLCQGGLGAVMATDEQEILGKNMAT